jgi:fermentation-respiration switch protein FrsA (DUF1100 family)
MKKRAFAAAGLMALALAACSGADDADGSPAGASWSAQEPARCGLASYQWLASDQVGQVLESQLAQEVSISTLTGMKTLLAGTVKLSRPIQYDVKLHVVRYRTQDKGNPVEATGMVGIPVVPAGTTIPILEFSHGTSGFDDACAPSHHAGDRMKSLTAVALIYAGFGYVSVLPDYIGMKSVGEPSPGPLPYMIGEPTAIATLDAIRAAKQLVAEEAPELVPGKIVLSGHSQGGHGTLVTTRFAPHYAPELEIAGAIAVAAIGDLIGGMRELLQNVTGPGLRLGLAYAYLNRRWYGAGELSDFLLPPWEAQEASVVQAACGADYVSPVDPAASATELFQPALFELAEGDGSGLEPWSCYLRENDPVKMPQPIDPTPTLFVLGEADDLVFPGPQRGAFDKLCARGAKLVYLECSAADHGAALTDSLDDQLDFVEARLRGDPLASSCERKPAQECQSKP